MTTPEGSAQIHIADMKGGSGAADYTIQVAGDMNAQVADANGVLKYTPISGGGLEQMAVPALLVLANNVAPKLVKRAGNNTYKKGGKKSSNRRGGMKVVGGSELTPDIKMKVNIKSQAIKGMMTHLNSKFTIEFSALIDQINKASTTDDAVVILNNYRDSLSVNESDLERKQYIDFMNESGIAQIGYALDSNYKEKQKDSIPTTGGNMLQQAIVPATLVLASNMLGKKGMRKMSSFTKRRSSRRRNNRRKRVSRRFRRGPR